MKSSLERVPERKRRRRTRGCLVGSRVAPESRVDGASARPPLGDSSRWRAALAAQSGESVSQRGISLFTSSAGRRRRRRCSSLGRRLAPSPGGGGGGALFASFRAASLVQRVRFTLDFFSRSFPRTPLGTGWRAISTPSRAANLNRAPTEQKSAPWPCSRRRFFFGRSLATISTRKHSKQPLERRHRGDARSGKKRA